MDQHISEERLTAFVDGEMSESESESIQTHLETCDKCTAYVDEMRSLFADLSNLESAPDERELLTDTMQLWQLMNQQAQSSGNRFSLQGLKNSYKFIAVGAVAAGLAIGILFGNIASLEAIGFTVGLVAHLAIDLEIQRLVSDDRAAERIP